VSTPTAKIWLCAASRAGRRRWVSLIKSRATRVSYLNSLKGLVLEQCPELEQVRPSTHRTCYRIVLIAASYMCTLCHRHWKTPQSLRLLTLVTVSFPLELVCCSSAWTCVKMGHSGTRTVARDSEPDAREEVRWLCTGAKVSTLQITGHSDTVEHVLRVTIPR